MQTIDLVMAARHGSDDEDLFSTKYGKKSVLRHSINHDTRKSRDF